MAGIGTEKLVSLNTLVFGSPEFLFWYLPVFVLLFYLVPAKWKDAVLFAGSILLYGLGEPAYCFVLLGMTAVNYLFGVSLDIDGISGKRQAVRKGIFGIAVACNAGLLCYFKISSAFDRGLFLPVGISFYTFKAISYLADVYLGKIRAERSWIRFGAYLSMFFQVVSGPIMRYDTAMNSGRERRGSVQLLESGLKKIIIGLSAKVLIADRLGILWNDVQTIGFESISTPLAWLGMFAYSLQLYFDFAGYSMIAVGIGEMFGFPLVKNFDFPYASRSVSEFYRRWHMTLGTWFRDYVYIPLGGNRRGIMRMLLNLLAVWLMTGLWHGGSVNFLLWGGVLCALVIFEKLGIASYLKRHKLISHCYVLLVIPLTWMIFAIPSIKEIGIYFSRLFPVFGAGVAVNEADFLKELEQFYPVLVAGILFSIPALGKWYEERKDSVWMNSILFFLFWICVYQMSNAVNNPFMYATF